MWCDVSSRLRTGCGLNRRNEKCTKVPHKKFSGIDSVETAYWFRFFVRTVLQWMIRYKTTMNFRFWATRDSEYNLQYLMFGIRCIQVSLWCMCCTRIDINVLDKRTASDSYRFPDHWRGCLTVLSPGLLIISVPPLRIDKSSTPPFHRYLLISWLRAFKFFPLLPHSFTHETRQRETSVK